MLEVGSESTGDDRTAAFRLMPNDQVVSFTANVPLASSGTAWLTAVLPIAMRADSDLTVLDTVDPIALRNARAAQEMLAGWYPGMSEVTVSASAGKARDARARGVGCFFSGGVDSFYSVLTRLDEITHLIFVHGFDIPVSDEALAARAIAAAEAAAKDLGRPLIIVRTDVRRFSDTAARWGEEYHGAALATVAHLLGDIVGTVIIPASYHERDLFPWGSHPELDPLWSSSAVRIEHHGTDMERAQKVAAISRSEVALAHLRVCWEDPHRLYNCGRCGKCLRTMIDLQAAGALDRCATLPHTIDPEEIRRMRLTRGGILHARESLAALRAAGTRDRGLERELRGLVNRTLARDRARAVKRSIRGGLRWVSRAVRPGVPS